MHPDMLDAIEEEHVLGEILEMRLQHRVNREDAGEIERMRRHSAGRSSGALR